MRQFYTEDGLFLRFVSPAKAVTTSILDSVTGVGRANNDNKSNLTKYYIYMIIYVYINIYTYILV